MSKSKRYIMVSVNYANALLRSGQNKYNCGFQEGFCSGLFIGITSLTIIITLYILISATIQQTEPKENPRIIYDKTHRKIKNE